MMKGLTAMPPIKLVLDGASDSRSSSGDPDSILAKAEELTPEENLQVRQFSARIDLCKTDVAASYGATVQKQSASIAAKTLDGVRSMRTGEIGDLLIELVAALDSLEGSSDKGGVIADFFGMFTDRSAGVTVRREDAEAVVDRIERQLEGHKLSLRKDIVMLSELYRENWELYKTLTMYIKAGEQALDRAVNVELPALESRAKMYGYPEDVMNVDIFRGNCEQFEKQLHQLRLTRTICLQSAPQILMLRRSDEDLLIKLQSSIVNTIPLWKQKAAMSTAMSGSKNASAAFGTLDSATNSMLGDHASRLRLSLAEAVRQAQNEPSGESAIELVNREITGAVSDYLKAEKQESRYRSETAEAVERTRKELSLNIKI